MGRKTPRNRPCTLYITNLANYEAFIEFSNKAGFEIRIEDWRYTMHGMLITFPMRDHAFKFREVMNERDVQGDQVSIVKATTQKEGADTRNPVNAVPTEAAILRAFEETYAPTTSASQLAEVQITSPSSPSPQGFDQSEKDSDIGDEDYHDRDMTGPKRKRAASEPLPPKRRYNMA